MYCNNDFILDHLIWVYNGDGLNRLGIGTAACVASRHSESHLAAVHFKKYFVVIWGQLPPGPASGVSKNISEFRLEYSRHTGLSSFQISLCISQYSLARVSDFEHPALCHVWCHDTPELVSLRLSLS